MKLIKLLTKIFCCNFCQCMVFNIGVIDINRWSVKVPNLWFGLDHYFKNILVFLEYHSPHLSLLFIKSASLVCVPNARIATYYLRIFDRMLKLNVSMTCCLLFITVLYLKSKTCTWGVWGSRQRMVGSDFCSAGKAQTCQPAK